jgi:hypothetical protein
MCQCPISQQRIDMTGEAYRDDLIDNYNGYASDGVELFEADEHTMNELQPNRRT